MNSMRPKQRRRQTRQALIKSAYALVVRRGVHALTITTLVARAKVSRATFYTHFQTLEDLLWALLEARLEQLHRTLAALDHASYHDRWSVVFDFAFEHAALIVALLGDEGFPSLRRRMEETVAAHVTREVERGARTPRASVSTSMVAQFMAGAFMRLTLCALQSQDPASSKETAQAFFSMTQTLFEDSSAHDVVEECVRPL